MTIRLIEGFDACTDITKLAGKWTAVSSATLSASGGRFNSGYISLSYAGACSRTFDAQQTWIVGCARMITSPLSATDVLTFQDSGSTQILIHHDSNGAISIWRGYTQIAVSSGFSLSPDTWYYIEAKAFIASTGGYVTVKVNGTTVVSVSNVNTQNTANASANSIQFSHTASGSCHAYIDDITILDGTGTINDFQGDCRVRTLLAAADDTVMFARSAGGYNYANVDDPSPNDDTDYNLSSTVGDKDFLAFNDLPANPGVIKCVQVSARARKDDSGARSLKTKVKSGGTEGNGAVSALSTSYTYITDVFATDPHTGAAWTDTAVNASSVGYELIS